MNGKELLDKMSEVDPKLIEGAYKDDEKSEKPKSRRALFIGLGSGMAAIAAALAVFIGVKAGLANRDAVGTSASGGNYSSAVNGIDNLPATNGGNEENSADKGAIDEASVSGTLGIQSPESVNITPEAVLDEDFTEYVNLPMISNQNYAVNGFGNGPTGSGVYSIYEGNEPKTLKTFSPWSLDTELTTLPVFLSNSTTPDVNKMTERVKNAAAILGIPESELEIVNRSLNVGDLDSYRKILEEHDLSEEEIEAELERVGRYSAAQGSIEAKSSRATIYAYTNGSIWIDFNEPYPELPDGYGLDLHDPDPDVLAATVEYLAEEYKELFGYQDPKVARYEGNFEYEYGVYEAEGDFAAQIANYWLKYAEFVPNWENTREINMLRMYTADNLEKLGDYPIYTAQQALWVMQSDRVPEEVRIPEGAEIVKVELEYKNLTGYTAVIPYYEFTVKTDEISEYSGELIYRHYRIPAVPEQFLDMTIEDYGVRA